MTSWLHPDGRPFAESPDGRGFRASRFVWDALAADLGIVDVVDEGEQYLAAIAARFPDEATLRTALRLAYWRRMDRRIAEEAGG